MFAVVSHAIDIAALEEAVRTRACGAVVRFTGIVRDHADDGRAVTGLSYEAHARMAEREFSCIADEARARFGECNIGVVHRTGDLNIGEIAVAVIVAAAHRGVAFQACAYVIDELKARATIWKKEHYCDGASAWKQNACNASSH